MKVTFPHMGNCWPAFKVLCTGVGAEVYLPDPNNVKQLDAGLKHSPEWVCFPFKVTLSNFIEALDEGVDSLVMATDCGPCRFGFYYAVQERILRDLGYDFKMYYLPQGDLLDFKWIKLLKALSEDKSLLNYFRIFRTARLFLMKSQLIQTVEKLEGKIRCYEVNKGDTTHTLNKCIQLIDDANTFNELNKLRKRIKNEFDKIEINKRDNNGILKVGLSGEIQVTLDPFVNHDIKRKLGELGCEVHMNLSLYDWIKHKFHVNFHRKYLEYLNKSQKNIGGLQMDIGGEAFWVMGEYIDYAQRGFDGFVHIYPFTCMPEITAKSILTKWYGNKYFDIPPIFFGFDEHSGEAGLITRLESYVDLLKNKKEKKNNGNGRK
ncbi:MAG: CoA protein activase [Candidatus Helarchaeota archaeon]